MQLEKSRRLIRLGGRALGKLKQSATDKGKRSEQEEGVVEAHVSI